MNILVIGGTGFIGSNLCNELVKNEKNNIFCLDNNFTGNLKNIKELLKKKILITFIMIYFNQLN